MPTPSTLDAAERCARLLDCGLTRAQLAAVADLIETGAHPEVCVRGGWGEGEAGRLETCLFSSRRDASTLPFPPQAVAAAVRALKREAASLNR